MSSRPEYVLAVDPGLAGALCLLRCSGLKIEGVFDMPVTDGRVDAARLALIVGMCQLRGTIVAAVERVGSRPHQAHAFSFGTDFGIVLGVLGSLGVTTTLIQPVQWKSSYGLRRATDETQAGTKTRARVLASKLWPESAKLFARVKDSDRAEASLIGRFWASKNEWL